MPNIQTPMTASIVGVSGSPSSYSKTGALVDHVLRRLQAQGSVAHLRLTDIDPAALVRAQTENRSLARAIKLVKHAEALVIATPIYKASFSGLLKLFLDAQPQFAFAGKVILPIATGGSPAHVLALDYAIRPVLQSMGARHVVQSVFVRASDLEIDGDEINVAPDAAALLDEAMLHVGHAMRASVGSAPLLGHPRPSREAPSAVLPDGHEGRIRQAASSG